MLRKYRNVSSVLRAFVNFRSFAHGSLLGSFETLSSHFMGRNLATSGDIASLSLGNRSATR